jgi:hypothetical protein
MSITEEHKAPLGKAMFLGAIRNFLVTVIGPTLLLFGYGFSISDGNWKSDLVLILLVFAGVGAGGVYVLNQFVVLLPLTWYHRSRFPKTTASEFKGSCFGWVILADVMAILALYLVIPKAGEQGLVWYLLFFMISGLYGTKQYVEAITAVAPLAAEPPPEKTGTDTSAREA